MSNFYKLCVNISGHDASRAAAIKDAANGEWEFDAWDEHPGTVMASGYDYLCAGAESEKLFAERLAKKVWRANGKFCNVVIHATCLEYLPYETHSLNENDFERLNAEIEESANAPSA